MKITMSSIPLTTSSDYSPTMDGYSKHLVITSVEELSLIEDVVKSDIHAFKVYQNDSRRGNTIGYNDDGSKIKAPVVVETMSGIIFDIDEGCTIEEFELLPISMLFIHVLYTSRSHKIVKHKGEKNEQAACDRFHVFFPFENDSSNCKEIIESCISLKNVFKSKGIVIDPAITVDSTRLIFPSRLEHKTVDSSFIFNISSDDNRSFITEEYLETYRTLDAMETYKDSMTVYSAQSADDAEYLKAVEYLKTKKYNSYNQWLAAATSIKCHFGSEAGLQIFNDLCNNVNYPKESANVMFNKFKSLSVNVKYEKAIFAVANEIAVSNNDSVRFLTKSSITKGRAIKNKDFDTEIEYTGDNYIDFFNSFMGLSDTGHIWIKFGFKNTWELMKPQDVRTIMKPYLITSNELDTKGKLKIVNVEAFDKWLQSPERRLIHKITFSTDLNYKKNEINLFTGYAVEPIPCSNDELYLFSDYVLNVLADGNVQIAEYIINYSAKIIQLQKNKHTLILQGEQGTGKSTYTDILVKILGTSITTKIQHKDHLTGKFNAHLANKVLAYMEEALFYNKKDSDNRDSDALKTLSTDSKIKIEIKGGATFDVDNRLSIVLTTNHDFPMDISKGDRRNAMFTVSEVKMQDAEYFDKLYKWLEDDGYGKLLYYFQGYKTSDLSIPDSSLKKNSMLNSLRSAEKFIVELFKNNGTLDIYSYDSSDAISLNLSGNIQSSLLYNKFLLWCNLTKSEVVNNIAFGIKFGKLTGVVSKLVSFAGVKVKCFPIDINQCKGAINAYYKTNMFSDDSDVELKVNTQPVIVAKTQPLLVFEPQIAPTIVEKEIVVQTSTPVIKQASMTDVITEDLATLEQRILNTPVGAVVKAAKISNEPFSYNKENEVMFIASNPYLRQYILVSGVESKNTSKFTLTSKTVLNAAI